MKRIALLLALVPLAACDQVKEWHPKPDPKAEAAAKRREAALKRIDGAAVSKYYAPSVVAGKDGVAPADNAPRATLGKGPNWPMPPASGSLTSATPPGKPQAAATGKPVNPNADRDKAAVAKAEAQRRAAMIVQARRDAAAYAKSRASAQERKLPAKGGDVTLPAERR